LQPQVVKSLKPILRPLHGGYQPTILAQGNSSQDPILKISNMKQGWWSGSSGRTPAWQTQGPEFKPQY
jgi:hypothetical protein